MRSLSKLAIILACASAGARAQGPAPQEGPDRHSPLASATGFLKAAHADDYETAARFLDLGGIPPKDRATEGPRLARRLRFVIDRALWLDFSQLSAQPEGNAPVELLGRVSVPGGSHAVRLRAEMEDGERVWLFSQDTVRGIDAMFEAHGSPLEEKLPAFFFVRPFWVLELWQWAALLATVVVAIPLSRVLARLLRLAARRALPVKASEWDYFVIDAAHAPLQFPFLALAAAALPRLASFPPPATDALDLVARSLLILSLAWFLLRFVRVTTVRLERHVAEGDELAAARARGLKTQLVVLRRVADVAIYVVTGSVLLLQFEAVRSVGVSLLASAGIAGLVLGFAAQKSIASLFAGIQLSITQPIRIGDAVVVDAEWGTIEEITLTYVVVKLWDLRRLVVPISQFLEKSFQNWSRMSPEVLGSVDLVVDYHTELEELRSELARVLERDAAGLWDGRIRRLEVIGSSEDTMTVRAVVSAPDAEKQWNLRCLVREKLIEYLRARPPGLPPPRALPPPKPPAETAGAGAARP